MAFCGTCGQPLDEGVEVCPACGARVNNAPGNATGEGFRTRDEWLASNAQSAGIEPGFSSKFDAPEFQAALKTGNSFNTRLLLGLTLGLPPAITLIALLVSPQSAAISIAVCIVVYLIVIPVVAYFLIKRNTAKPWDGEVVDLVCRTSYKSADMYCIICRTDEGKQQKVQDYGRSMFDYLHIGDRVRFHPRLNVPLEKYDKTHDSYLLCPFCGRQQSLSNDSCDKCGKPLLK